MTKLINDKIEEALNKQVKIEFTAAHIYRAFAMWCDKYGYLGAKVHFLKQAEEEQKHGQKVLDYIVDREGHCKIPALGEVPCEYANMKEVLDLYMQHEVAVEQTWRLVTELTKLEKDQSTFNFAQWYLGEQVEEIGKVGDLIAQYEMYAQGGNIGYACGEIDKVMLNL